ncbi:cytochrome c biogenesis CcdA family protein [Canibacter zhoujuaniae]|uniref:cytochrome c biogenesis CcdA family protein n=1 Tax=Canibacter zhoujuaniae TaxID=2708343 RepID=UPI001421A6BD|nr:cytochrome c biogenesis protein CcdA [Canibacter zhoujuaniae]
MPVESLIYEGSVLAAALVAVLAGALSFFSPCVLPLVPGYLAYVGGSAELAAAATTGAGRKRLRALGGQRRMLAGAALFVLGFSAVFIALITLSGVIGAWLLRWEMLITQIFGALVIVLGLAFIGVFKPLQRTHKTNSKPAVGLAGAPLLGAVFAIGWTPCMGPTLGVIMSLSLTQGTAGRGAILGIAYCLGLGIPFLLVAAGFGWMARAIGWIRKNMRAVNIAGGVILILIGILMLTGLWTRMMYVLQAWIGGFVLPL